MSLKYNEEAIIILQQYSFSMLDIIACRNAILSGNEVAIGYWKLRAVYEAIAEPNGSTSGMSYHDWSNVIDAFRKNLWLHDEYIAAVKECELRS